MNNFINTVNRAVDKKENILSNKKSELLLLDVRKEQIVEELKEAKNNYFLYADDEEKVKAFEDKEKELTDINEKIIKLKSQITLLQANFYVDYEIQDISKELRLIIENSGLNKDLEAVNKKITSLKKLATKIEAKRNNIAAEFGKYIQSTSYLPKEKQKLYKREIKDLEDKELIMKIASSDITAFIDCVVGYYRKHEKIFK